MDLKTRQRYPLELKVEMSKLRIREWYRHYYGKVYVAFSGGKDSTVLLDLVRSEYPEVPALFVDTGLEFPEIRQFVKTINNVVWVKPKKSFKYVIDRYGYPVISKMVAMAISRYRNTKSDRVRDYRLNGRWENGKKKIVGTIPKKYHYLINAPFKIGEQCCDHLKKRPFKDYEKSSGLKPFVGSMASDSNIRAMRYIKYGCNDYKGTSRSNPIAFWMEDDIWNYLKGKNLPYSSIYDMGYHNTGCAFCLFGIHLEGKPNRFDMMKETHPKLYNYCMDKLGIREVLNFIGVN